MSRCLVTGGAGFIGSHLVEKLLEEQEEVIILDNLSSGNLENIQHVLDKIQWVHGDIRDLALLEKVMQGVDLVFHQAALRSVPLSVRDPLAFNEVNVCGTLNVLLAAKKAKVKRVIFASSSSIYGDIQPLKEEEMRPQPISPYAVSKVAGELYCSVFTKLHGLETVVLRYFNVFGPRQDPHSQYAAVIPAFISRVLANEPPIIYGDGLQSRDFTYVANVTVANLKAAQASGVSGRVFNIACGKNYTLLEVLGHISSILGKEIKPKFLPPREGDVRHTLADINLAGQYLKIDSLIGFEEGLRETIAWMDQTNSVKMSEAREQR